MLTARFLLSFIRLRLWCWAAGFLLISACTSRPAVPSRQNVATNYRPGADMGLTTDHIMHPDSMVVWVRFGSQAVFKGRFANDLTLQVRVSPGYDSAQPLHRDSVTALEGKVQWQAGRAVARLAVPANVLMPGGVVSITLLDRIGDQTGTVDIPLTAHALAKQLLLMEANSTLPLFRHYLNPQDSFRIVTTTRTAPVKAERYQADFPAALPPMSLSPKKATPKIPLLDSLQLPATITLHLRQNGLYLLRPPHGSTAIVLVERDEYPELTTARDLIEPLIYITTSKERNALYQAADPKIAVDKFWLGIGGSENFARALIRSYYSRVIDANRLFTSHKPGWMSDRGMIYIVMGQPTAVHRYFDREEWTYAATSDRSATEFTFYRLDHTLTHNHYELQRDPVFEPVWYKAAERWRKGITDQ